MARLFFTKSLPTTTNKFSIHNFADNAHISKIICNLGALYGVHSVVSNGTTLIIRSAGVFNCFHALDYIIH